jgi:hypothetical protein
MTDGELQALVLLSIEKLLLLLRMTAQRRDTPCAERVLCCRKASNVRYGGHSRPITHDRAMSALPPIASVDEGGWHVR